MWNIWEHMAEFVTNSQLWHRLAVMNCMAIPLQNSLLFKARQRISRWSSCFSLQLLMYRFWNPTIQKSKNNQAEAVLRYYWGNVRMFCKRNWDFLFWPAGSVSGVFFCLLPLSSWKQKYVIQVSKVMLYTLRGEKIKGI